jgi:hypothetical protein
MSKEGIGAMAERLGNANPAAELTLTRGQMENNIKAAHNWRTAVAAGTFKGHECIHIATLLDFLNVQHKISTEQYEAAFTKDVSFERPLSKDVPVKSDTVGQAA